MLSSMVFKLETVLSIRKNIDKPSKIQFFVAFLVLVSTVVTLQDLFHSQRNQYNFYFSESVLFNSYWLWFYPVTILSKYIFNLKGSVIHKYLGIRIFSFIVLSTTIHVLAYSFSVFGVSYLFYEGTYEVKKMFTYSVSNDFYKYVFGYGFIGFLLLRGSELNKQTDFSVPEKREIVNNIAVMENGRNKVLVPITDIVFIKSSSPYIALQTSAKVYLHTASLKSINEHLTSHSFLQIHKSIIININKVVSFKSRLNGDYDVLMDNGQEVRLSRNYAARFKQVIHINSSL